MVLFTQASVPLLRACYLVRVPPFRTFNAPFDLSHRSSARRTCSPSPIPSRCLTRLSPAAISGSKRNECSRFGTQAIICRSTYGCKRTTSETLGLDSERSASHPAYRPRDQAGIVRGVPPPTLTPAPDPDIFSSIFLSSCSRCEPLAPRSERQKPFFLRQRSTRGESLPCALERMGETGKDGQVFDTGREHSQS